MTPMTDDEMVLELRREAAYLRTRTGHHQRPVMAAVHDQIADHLHALSADASLGALVRRIREHPKSHEALACVCCTEVPVRYPASRVYFDLDDDDLTRCLSHLDSLVPVEPKVVTGPSGREYRRRADGAVEIRDNDDENGRRIGWIALPTAIYACDAPVVAALMAKGGKDE